MLILTRKTGETIRIGDEVTVTVLSIQGNQVKLGITAPRSVEVHREEIYERIALEKAAGGTPRPVGRAALKPASADATEADREETLSVAGVSLGRVTYRRRKL